MNLEQLKTKYCMDKTPYVAPHYLINGKKSSHLDVISLARKMGLPTEIRKNSILGFAQEVASGKNPKYKGKIVESAKQFVQMVKGPFKD